MSDATTYSSSYIDQLEELAQKLTIANQRISELEAENTEIRRQHTNRAMQVEQLQARLDAAPHDSMCAITIGDPCDCWKAGKKWDDPECIEAALEGERE